MHCLKGPVSVSAQTLLTSACPQLPAAPTKSFSDGGRKHEMPPPPNAFSPPRKPTPTPQRADTTVLSPLLTKPAGHQLSFWANARRIPSSPKHLSWCNVARRVPCPAGLLLPQLAPRRGHPLPCPRLLRACQNVLGLDGMQRSCSWLAKKGAGDPHSPYLKNKGRVLDYFSSF